jgi:secreted trypsin-like serine protease
MAALSWPSILPCFVAMDLPDRIYLGEKAQVGQFPFAVRIVTTYTDYPYGTLCSGSLISDSIVLTAGKKSFGLYCWSRISVKNHR